MKDTDGMCRWTAVAVAVVFCVSPCFADSLASAPGASWHADFLPTSLSRYLQSVQGNAFWDCTKCLFKYAYLIPLIFLFLLVPALRRLIFCYCDGWRILWSDHYAYVVNARKSRRRIRDFVSTARTALVATLFGKNEIAAAGVFVVMGPDSVGKRTLIRTKFDPRRHVLINVPWRHWHGGNNADVMMRKLLRKINFLLLGFSWGRRTYITLEWSKVEPVPSYEEFLRIVTKVARYWGKNARRKRLLAFVLKFPVYYWIASLDRCAGVKFLNVNILNCAESANLAQAEIKAVSNRSHPASELQTRLESRAKTIGVCVDRLVWASTLGLPKHVVAFVDSLEYCDAEAWKNLIQWWARAYNPEEEERGRWLALFYFLALLGEDDSGGVVDVRKLAVAVGLCSGEGVADRVVSALKRLIVQEDRDGRSVDFSRFDPALLFQNEYMRMALVASFGRIQGAVDFSESLRMCVPRFSSLFLDKTGDMQNVALAIAKNVAGEGSAAARIEKLLMSRVLVQDVMAGTALGEYYVSHAFYHEIFHVVEEFAFSADVLEMNHFYEQIQKIIGQIQVELPAKECIEIVWHVLCVSFFAGLLSSHWGVDFGVLCKRALESGDSRSVRLVLLMAFLADGPYSLDFGKVAPGKGGTYAHVRTMLQEKTSPETLSFLEDLGGFAHLLCVGRVTFEANVPQSEKAYAHDQSARFVELFTRVECPERVAMLACCCSSTLHAQLAACWLDGLSPVFMEHRPENEREYALLIKARARLSRDLLATVPKDGTTCAEIVNTWLNIMSQTPAFARCALTIVQSILSGMKHDCHAPEVIGAKAREVWAKIREWESCMGRLSFAETFPDMVRIASLCNRASVHMELQDIWMRFWSRANIETLSIGVQYYDAVDALSWTPFNLKFKKELIEASGWFVLNGDERILPIILRRMLVINTEVLRSDKRYLLVAMQMAVRSIPFSEEPRKNILAADAMVERTRKDAPQRYDTAIVDFARRTAVESLKG